MLLEFKPRALITFSLVVGLMGSLAGCQAKGTASNSLDHVTLRLNWQPGAEHAPYYVAVDKGYFSDVGIDIDIHVGSGSADSVKLTAVGDADFALAAGANVIQGRAQEIPVRVIAVIYQDDPTSFTVLSDSGIDSVSDLVGKNIGVAFESSTFPEYLALLKHNQIDRSQ